MSAKLDIFNDIVTELKKISDIETIELWNNQLDNENKEISFNFPAVFIEFADLPWSSTNQQTPRLGTSGNISKQQKGEGALITLHIAFSPLEDETISFPIISPIIDRVYLAVQGLNKEFYGPLLRVTERQDADHNRVIDWQMDFSTMMFESGEIDETLTQIPSGTIDVIPSIDLDIDNNVIRSGDEKI